MVAQDSVDIAKSEAIIDESKADYLSKNDGSLHLKNTSEAGVDYDPDYDVTDHDLANLRRVSGSIPWTAYTVAFVELCERFSYYGATAVFVNFIQRPLPPGSTTGAAGTHGQPGALGMGQQASTGLTTFNSFFAYIMPIAGAYVADEFLGRYKTIQYAIGFAQVGHILLIISALPPVIQHPHGAIACLSLGIVIMGCGTGGFKSNISPLIAEQYKETRMKLVTLPSGERVISDPAATVARIFLYFYMCVNIGSLIGQIGMVYAEKYVGFWLSFTLPTIMFCIAPVVLLFARKYYTLSPPTGSVTSKTLKLLRFAMKGRWSWNPIQTYKSLTAPDFWENAKPSRVVNKPDWMIFDDAWVDQVRRGIKACGLFLWYPLYWLAYNQMLNNLTSQAATMRLGGVPNDVINNLNPLSLIIMIPIFDHVIYPGIRKMGFNFTPVKRITMGFFIASAAMISATVMQYYIYKLGPCGNRMNSCDEPAPISVWAQTVTYILIGISEIFASITGLEYAFTKAPKNMRSLVTSFFLFQNALSSAVGQALVPLADDPHLIINYAIPAGLAFAGGIGFWFSNRHLDAEEDHLNMLVDSNFKGRHPPNLQDPEKSEN